MYDFGVSASLDIIRMITIHIHYVLNTGLEACDYDGNNWDLIQPSNHYYFYCDGLLYPFQSQSMPQKNSSHTQLR